MTTTSAIHTIIDTVEKAFLGNRDAVELAVCTFLSGGHLLIEDMPGVGKTTMAKAMAAAFGGQFSRIQFTSDLLPSDILGISVWNRNTSAFEFQKGPIFANIILADEINRASPKTQSALLEAMSERQVSQDGTTYALHAPFMVIATQNANESFGTYPLPESQLDRFTMRLQLGYASGDIEKKVIRAGGEFQPSSMGQAISGNELTAVIHDVENTHVDESILEYVMAIVKKTRDANRLNFGASPRGSIALVKCAKAYARIRGRDYVQVDDIQKLAIPVIAHRLVGKSDSVYAGGQVTSAETLLRQLVQSIDVPV